MTKETPREGEVKDGQMFWNGEWVDIVDVKNSKTENKHSVPMEIHIGNNIVLKGIATPKTFEKSGRKGYTGQISAGQVLFGNINLFLRG